MSTNAEILQLAQWFSPAYPVGAFAYSHGLETAIQDKRIASAAALQDWLEDVIACGSGQNDCILLRAAFASVSLDDVAEVDAVARAFCASKERLMETELQGAAFCKTTAALSGLTIPELTFPVGVGYAAAQLGFGVDLTASMYLQAFASNLVSAAVRLVPLGQTEGQAVLSALTPLCDQVARDSGGCDLDDMQSTAFLADIAAMNHESLESRIFRS